MSVKHRKKRKKNMHGNTVGKFTVVSFARTHTHAQIRTQAVQTKRRKWRRFRSPQWRRRQWSSASHSILRSQRDNGYGIDSTNSQMGPRWRRRRCAHDIYRVSFHFFSSLCSFSNKKRTSERWFVSRLDLRIIGRRIKAVHKNVEYG